MMRMTSFLSLSLAAFVSSYRFLAHGRRCASCVSGRPPKVSLLRARFVISASARAQVPVLIGALISRAILIIIDGYSGNHVAAASCIWLIMLLRWSAAARTNDAHPAISAMSSSFHVCLLACSCSACAASAYICVRSAGSAARREPAQNAHAHKARAAGARPLAMFIHVHIKSPQAGGRSPGRVRLTSRLTPAATVVSIHEVALLYC
jgi:hypothetical protein